jgi:hypothetical protein
MQSAQRGLPVILVAVPVHTACSPESIDGQSSSEDFLQELATRDYTGGLGLAYIEELLKAGAIVTTSLRASLDEVRKRIACQIAS